MSSLRTKIVETEEFGPVTVVVKPEKDPLVASETYVFEYEDAVFTAKVLYERDKFALRDVLEFVDARMWDEADVVVEVRDAVALPPTDTLHRFLHGELADITVERVKP